MDFRFQRQSSLSSRQYAASVSGGAGGSGIRISTGNGMRIGSGFGGYDSSSSSGALTMGNEKATMQHLNDRLANYLDKVKKLEKENGTLEIRIREAIEKRGPLEGRDYSKYYATIEDLRTKISSVTRGNAELSISLDNARLATDDFKTKMEYELMMRQTVEADVTNLRRLLDDTNVTRMHLEGDIESLKEELITLRKNHAAEVADLRAQISQAGLQVDVDARKGPDLSKIMEEMREKYERIALKNQEELKAWHESQITEVQVQVTESSTALKEAMSVMSETKRRYQSFDIEIQSQLSMKAALETQLKDMEARYSVEIERYNVILLRLQQELTQIRTDIQQKTREYEILLNIKEKLEGEIREYRRLLDGEADLTLVDALVPKTKSTNVVVITQTIEDGKVVSESKDVKTSEVAIP